MEEKAQANNGAAGGASEPTLPQDFMNDYDLSQDQFNKIKEKYKRDKDF
jgi:hypothetical protein